MKIQIVVNLTQKDTNEERSMNPMLTYILFILLLTMYLLIAQIIIIYLEVVVSIKQEVFICHTFYKFLANGRQN